MDREQDLIEIEAAIRSQVEKGNTFTFSVLQRCHELVSLLAGYERTGLTPEEIFVLHADNSALEKKVAEYYAIGAAKESREAMEKQKAKKQLKPQRGSDMRQMKCPKCGSAALYVPCTVSAKVDYNSDMQVAYSVNKHDIDCYYLASVTCKKCGWSGDERELEEQ